MKFYWYEEDTEIYAAQDLAELHRHLSAERRGWDGEAIPEFTEKNKGEVWGEVSPDETMIDDETGKHMTVTEFLATYKVPAPCQVCTCYA